MLARLTADVGCRRVVAADVVGVCHSKCCPHRIDREAVGGDDSRTHFDDDICSDHDARAVSLSGPTCGPGSRLTAWRDGWEFGATRSRRFRVYITAYDLWNSSVSSVSVTARVSVATVQL